MKRVLAINNQGNITYCTVEPENRGKGRCNHIAHQEAHESTEQFIERANKLVLEKENKNNESVEGAKEISQEEIDAYASQISEIAGEEVTLENFKEVLTKLPPDKIAEITAIAFKAAPEFSLPITDEYYEDENMKNKLYFANLPAYGIAGNAASIKQMFDKVGMSPTLDGEEMVEHSYKEGLTPREYFIRQFNARDALINKGVSTSKPGFCVYENSTVEIKDLDSTVKILWKELQVGDTFIDGSQVVEIQPWSEKECYELQIEGYDKIVLSHDHLVYGEILVNNKPVENLAKSAQSRANVGETDKKWICIEDVYEFYQLGAHIKLNEDHRLEYIEKFKNGAPQRVRCISTSTGFYETNGLINHNTARKLFYAMSDTQVVSDCGGAHIDAMHCSMPEGHVCAKCANKTKGGERIKEGQLVGGLISTNLSEALTQLSMKQMHVGAAQVKEQQGGSSVIMATLDGWGTSPIVKKMHECKTTEEMRTTLYEGLKKLYSDAKIKQDDFNLQMVARKLTSYKRDNGGLRPVNPGERCDVVSIGTVGNANNIFKVSELSSGYKYLTVPNKQELKTDAANQILR